MTQVFDSAFSGSPRPAQNGSGLTEKEPADTTGATRAQQGQSPGADAPPLTESQAESYAKSSGRRHVM